MQDLLESPSSHTTETQSSLLPCPGAAGAGRQDLGSSPRNIVTDPDSEDEQPCPSCRCFLERSDLALSKIGTPRNRWNSGITCFPFAQFQVFYFLFLFSGWALLLLMLIFWFEQLLMWERHTEKSIHIISELQDSFQRNGMCFFRCYCQEIFTVLKLKSLFLIFKKPAFTVKFWSEHRIWILCWALTWDRFVSWARNFTSSLVFLFEIFFFLPAEFYKHPSKKNLEKRAVIQLLIITILLLCLVT